MILWANANGIITFFGKPVFPPSFYQPNAPSWWPTWFPSFIDTDHKPYLYSLVGRLAEAQAWHFTFLWIFTLNGLTYVVYLAISRESKWILPRKESLKQSILVVLHDLRLIKKAPRQIGVYNDAQRIAYTGVIFLGLLMVLSGFSIYKPTQLYWLVALLGGYRFARWIHFWTSMLISLFFAVHVAQVVKTGWDNFRGMIIGYGITKRPLNPISDPDVSVKEEQIA